MTVPKSLKLSDADLPSFAQLGHQLVAAARPGMSIYELLLEEHVPARPRGNPHSDRRGRP
jgi:hypothetical protein